MIFIAKAVIAENLSIRKIESQNRIQIEEEKKKLINPNR